MRVNVQNLDEFIESLKDVKTIFESTIRCSVVRRPAAGTGREPVVFHVSFQLTALVPLEAGEYLLDSGEMCGDDYEDASQEFTGTKKAAVLKQKLVEFATRKGWKVLPGVISE